MYRSDDGDAMCSGPCGSWNEMTIIIRSVTRGNVRDETGKHRDSNPVVETLQNSISPTLNNIIINNV